jgi:hypothetical protein
VTRSQETMFRGARVRKAQERIARLVIGKVLADEAPQSATRAAAHAIAIANLQKPWARRWLRSQGRFV